MHSTEFVNWHWGGCYLQCHPFPAERPEAGVDHVTALQQGLEHGAPLETDFLGDFPKSAQSCGSANTL